MSVKEEIVYMNLLDNRLCPRRFCFALRIEKIHEFTDKGVADPLWNPEANRATVNFRRVFKRCLIRDHKGCPPRFKRKREERKQ